MKPVTKKWIFMKASSILLIPLMFWFILNLVGIYDQNYQNLTSFITSQPSKFLFCLFIVVSYFFSALSISEVFEDYIHNEKIKNAANKALYFSAIIIPFVTILAIFNLNT